MNEDYLGQRDSICIVANSYANNNQTAVMVRLFKNEFTKTEIN